MIPAGPLDKLKESDPVLWDRYRDTEMAEVECADKECGYIRSLEPNDLMDDAQEAWLQHCLQDAIRARGWAYQVSISFQGTIYGKIVALNADGSKHFHQDQHADTEAEALCLAYIEAIEAVKV